MATLQDVMTPMVEYCSPSDDMNSLAKTMYENDIGFLPVMEEEQLVGCVTDRDIVIKGLSKERPAQEVKAESIMQEKVITGYPEMTVEEASRLMQDHQIKRLVVMEDQAPKGIVSLGDMALSKHADQAAGNALSEVSKQHPR